MFSLLFLFCRYSIFFLAFATGACALTSIVLFIATAFNQALLDYARAFVSGSLISAVGVILFLFLDWMATSLEEIMD